MYYAYVASKGKLNKFMSKEVETVEEGMIYGYQNRIFYDEIKIVKEQEVVLFHFKNGKAIFVNKEQLENGEELAKIVGFDENEPEKYTFIKEYDFSHTKRANERHII